MTETNKEQAPAHDCAEEVAEAMYECHAAHFADEIPNGIPGIRWHMLTDKERQAWIDVVKAAPRLIVTHAGDDLKAWLAAQIGTSSPWRSLLGYISAAGVGAAVLWGASFFTSCAPVMTPEQVQQWDAGHAAIHAATGTTCTLCSPVTHNGK